MVWSFTCAYICSTPKAKDDERLETKDWLSRMINEGNFLGAISTNASRQEVDLRELIFRNEKIGLFLANFYLNLAEISYNVSTKQIEK
jgi:hypothetical protein